MSTCRCSVTKSCHFGLIYRFRANTSALLQAGVQRYFLDRPHGCYRDAMIVNTMLPLILNLNCGSTGDTLFLCNHVVQPLCWHGANLKLASGEPKLGSGGYPHAQLSKLQGVIVQGDVRDAKAKKPGTIRIGISAKEFGLYHKCSQTAGNFLPQDHPMGWGETRQWRCPVAGFRHGVQGV